MKKQFEIEDPLKEISCEEVKKNLRDYSSGKLASRDIGLNARVKKHLRKPCIRCGNEFTNIRKKKERIR